MIDNIGRYVRWLPELLDTITSHLGTYRRLPDSFGVGLLHSSVAAMYKNLSQYSISTWNQSFQVWLLLWTFFTQLELINLLIFHQFIIETKLISLIHIQGYNRILKVKVSSIELHDIGDCLLLSTGYLSQLFWRE